MAVTPEKAHQRKINRIQRFPQFEARPSCQEKVQTTIVLLGSTKNTRAPSHRREHAMVDRCQHHHGEDEQKKIISSPLLHSGHAAAKNHECLVSDTESFLIGKSLLILLSEPTASPTAGPAISSTLLAAEDSSFCAVEAQIACQIVDGKKSQ